jgi:hypothetical protein
MIVQFWCHEIVPLNATWWSVSLLFVRQLELHFVLPLGRGGVIVGAQHGRFLQSNIIDGLQLN